MCVTMQLFFKCIDPEYEMYEAMQASRSCAAHPIRRKTFNVSGYISRNAIILLASVPVSACDHPSLKSAETPYKKSYFSLRHVLRASVVTVYGQFALCVPLCGPPFALK